MPLLMCLSDGLVQAVNIGWKPEATHAFINVLIRGFGLGSLHRMETRSSRCLYQCAHQMVWFRQLT